MFKKILHIITLNFLPNNRKVSIKCVSWLVFQIATAALFEKWTPLEKWLWNVDYDVEADLRKKQKYNG